MGRTSVNQEPGGDQLLAKIVRNLIEAYRPERIYLFGSYARGDAGPDSDYDLLIVVPDSAPVRQQGSRLAYEVLWETGTAADVLVCTRGQLRESPASCGLAPRDGRSGRKASLCRMIQSGSPTQDRDSRRQPAGAVGASQNTVKHGLLSST